MLRSKLEVSAASPVKGLHARRVPGPGNPDALQKNCHDPGKGHGNSGRLRGPPESRPAQGRILVLALIHQLVGGDPGHHGAQLRTDLFDLGFGIDAATRDERRGTGGIFQNEALGVFTGLDVLEALAHGSAGLVGHDARAGHVLAILRVVGDGVVHVGNAAFVDQVHDQLELVQALEVGHFRRVAGFRQRIETGLDQFDGTAAQNGLLTEQVGFGLFAEGRFDDAGTAAADGASVGQADVAGGTGLVLVHGDQCGHAAPLVVGAAHGVAGGLGSHHDDVDVIARLNLTVVDVEAVSKGQHGAGLDVGGDVVAVDLSDVLVGQQDHDEIGGLHGVAHFLNLQAGILGLGPGGAALAQADHHVHAGIMQVERVRVALRTVADDGDRLALDQRKIAILVVKNLHGVLQKFNGFSLKFQYTFATPDARHAGAHGLENGAAIERIDEGLDLSLVARQFDGVDLVGDVDDMAAEDVGHAFHLFAFLADGPDLDEHEFTLDVRAFGTIDHLDDSHQPVQVLGDLLDEFIGAGRDDGHPREGGIFRGGHRQRFDVVAACREQADDARQCAGFIFQKDGNHVFHLVASLQVFRTKQHLGEAPARLHHGPDVFRLIGDEVKEHQTIFVLAERFPQGRFDVGGSLDAQTHVTVAFHQLHEVGQRVHVGFRVARTIFDLLPLPHHAEVTVVEAENLGGQAVLLAGGELLDIHLDGALARDAGDLCVRVGHLCAHGVGQAHPHGAQATGVQPATRFVKLVVLGRPHLVLTDIGRDDGLATRDFPQLLDDELRLDDAVGAFVGQAAATPPFLDLLPPLGQGCAIAGGFGRRLFVQGQHVFEHALDVAHDRHVDPHSLGNAGGVDVDVDDFARVLREVLG